MLSTLPSFYLVFFLVMLKSIFLMGFLGKKNVEAFIAAGVDEYEKRLAPSMTLTTTFHKTDKDLLAAVVNLKGSTWALDENGVELRYSFRVTVYFGGSGWVCSSRQFSSALFKSFEDGGATVNFIIGGFNGLPAEIKASYKLISLSRMTWTHELARFLLLEQIYRACEIHKNTKYHKD